MRNCLDKICVKYGAIVVVVANPLENGGLSVRCCLRRDNRTIHIAENGAL
jgi:hypothetical protein